MKKIIKISLIILVVLAALSFGKNLIAKTAVQSGVGFMTGLKLNMREFDMSFLNTSLRIRDMKLFNPRGYQDKVMLDMPEIYVDFELQPLFAGKVHLAEVRIHMKEFVVEKNKGGQLNLDSLKPVKAQKKETAAAAPKKTKPAEKGKAPQMQVDSLKIRIEKVIYKDYSKGDKPFVQEFNMNLNESYSNITNPYSIVSLIVVKVMMNTSIASLANFDLGPLQSSVDEALASSKKIAAQAVSAANQQAKQLMDKSPEQFKEAAGLLEQKTKGLTRDLSKTADDLTEKIKFSFAKKE